MKELCLVRFTKVPLNEMDLNSLRLSWNTNREWHEWIKRIKFWWKMKKTKREGGRESELKTTRVTHLFPCSIFSYSPELTQNFHQKVSFFGLLIFSYLFSLFPSLFSFVFDFESLFNLYICVYSLLLLSSLLFFYIFFFWKRVILWK